MRVRAHHHCAGKFEVNLECKKIAAPFSHMGLGSVTARVVGMYSYMTARPSDWAEAKIKSNGAAAKRSQDVFDALGVVNSAYQFNSMRDYLTRQLGGDQNKTLKDYAELLPKTRPTEQESRRIWSETRMARDEHVRSLYKKVVGGAAGPSAVAEPTM